MAVVDDFFAEWSRADGLGLSLRFAGLNGDDVVTVVGDSRGASYLSPGSSTAIRFYHGMAGPTVNCSIIDDDSAGLEISYPFDDDPGGVGSVGAPKTKQFVGASAVSVDMFEGPTSVELELLHNELRYGVALRSRPRGPITVKLEVAFRRIGGGGEGGSYDGDSFRAVTVTHVETTSGIPTDFAPALVVSPLTITFEAPNGTDYGASAIAASGDDEDWWALPRLVVVEIPDNYIQGSAPSFRLVVHHDGTGGDDEGYSHFAAPQRSPFINVTVREDDEASVATVAGKNKAFLGCDYDGNSLFTDTFGLYLTAQPVRDVTLRLTASSDDVDGSFSSETKISTSRLTFTPQDWFVPRTVVVNATARSSRRSRRDRVNVELLDPSWFSSSYSMHDAFYGLAAAKIQSVAVSVTVTTDATPPPRVLSSEFGDSGASALLAFDRPTNQGGFLNGAFACGLLLGGPAMGGFGSESFCTWTSPSTLVATFSSDATVENLAVVTIRNNILKSNLPNTTLYLNNASYVLSAPPTAVAPQVIISAPLTIGRCDVLFLDGGQSSGSGGRTMDATWSVGGGSSDNPLVANLTRLLANASNANALSVQIAPEDIPYGVFNFTLRLENWLGNADALQVAVTKVNADAPTVRIAGYAQATTIYASDAIKLVAVATLPACGGGAGSELRFNWTESTGFLRRQLRQRGLVSPLELAGPYQRQLTIKAGYLSAPYT